MHWAQLLRDLGLPAPQSPHVEAIAATLVLVVAAYAIGWFAAHHIAPRIARRLYVWTGRTEDTGATSLSSVLQYALTAALLLLLLGSGMLGAIMMVLVAIALGISTALLAMVAARGAGLGAITTTIVTVAASVATTAAALGGMQPLIMGLDGIGFAVGTRRFSLMSAISFIVVVVVLFGAARIAGRILAHSIDHASALDGSQRALAHKLGGIGIVVIACLLGVDLLGIDLTAIKVFSGAFGLAVGFGLQKTFGNLISGLILLMDRSVKPGDVIVVGDTFGAVNKIGVRAVSVVTRDGKEHLIPNEQLMTQPVENWSYSSRNVRVHIPIGIAHDSNLPLAQRLMMEAASASERVLDMPRPSVWLKAFGESSVDHDILFWISDPEMGVGNVRSEVLNRLWVLFKENGIELPYPQRDIHIRSGPAKGLQPSVQDTDADR